MFKLLPKLESKSQYSSVFASYDWEPGVREITRHHSLKGDLTRGVLGSNIVYRAGDVWIKLFAPFFKREFSYELDGLKMVQNKVSFLTPHIVDTGVLEGWPYMILTHVPGSRIGDLWAHLSVAKRTRLAERISEITKELQTLNAPESILKRIDWNEFIQERFQDAANLQEGKGLSARSLSMLQEFMGKFSVEEFKTKNEVYIHSDLTADHFLIDERSGEITGVIDFADSMVGHSEYDLIAYFCYFLKGDFEAQKAFYRMWGDAISSERMLAWIILHRFSDLRRYFGDDLLNRASSFEQLASELFV